MPDYHIFFISQKQNFNVGGEDYQAWVVTVDAQDYYFMHPNDPRPDGFTVRNIDGVIASSGVNDMIYYVTRNLNEAVISIQADEFAGLGERSTAAAFVSFAVMSYEGKGAHAAFPKGAAARKAIKARWKEGGVMQPWQTVEDWVAAGYPMDTIHFDVSMRILGK
jgi:hypothetical protein